MVILFHSNNEQMSVGIIRLQIDFLLDMWMRHNSKMLYHQEISTDLMKG